MNNARSRARATDPFTSHIAAVLCASFAGTHADRIVKTLESGPMTADEIAEASGLDRYSVFRRLPEIQRKGIVRPTGNCRPSVTGNPSREWEVV